MSHTVLFIKLGLLPSNLFEHFTVSLFRRCSLLLGLPCLVRDFHLKPPFLTPLPLSKYYLFCHCQDTLAVTREIIGTEDRRRGAEAFWCSMNTLGCFWGCKSKPVSMSESTSLPSSKINVCLFFLPALTHISFHLRVAGVKLFTLEPPLY